MSKLCQRALDGDNYNLESVENRVIRTAVSSVQAGEKLVIIYTTEMKKDFTRAVEVCCYTRGACLAHCMTLSRL